MKKRILALLCVVALLMCDTNLAVFASQSDTGNIQDSGEEIESTEVDEIVESTESESELTETETTELIETETTELTETIESEGNLPEGIVNALSLDDENLVEDDEDEDPQSGTSMSNIEEEPVFPQFFSLYSQSGYTGNTYTHNSRYDSGYTIVNGIDVSKWNGSIDWSAVKASGIDYVIIRVGYRGLEQGTLNEDPYFRTNIQGAINADLKVGVYIFSQAISEAEAVEEANYVLNRIAGYNITLPVVIDYEYGANNSGRLAAANLSVDAATAVCSAFCNTVSSAGYTPMIYANKYMLESKLRGDILAQYYKIWLANYTTQTSYSGDYYAWQYSSAGSVNGISGSVDCNFFYEKNNYQNAVLYVTGLYQNLLGREPDATGLNAYVTDIVNGKQTASSVAAELISSTEFKNKKYNNSTYVSKLYLALLKRNAGSSEITNWTSRMANGVSERYILAQIAGSTEFTNICNAYGIPRGTVTLIENRDKNYNATAYVMRCYQKILGRNADTVGLNTWTGKLLNGSGGAEIVRDLVYSDEFKGKKYSDSQFIDILYNSMLGRSADSKGKQDWMNRLDQGVSYVYIINGFAGSDEFNNMCKSYGITAGKAPITEPRDKNINVTGFVNRCYTKVLIREGEAEGLNNWCNALLNKTRTPKEVAYEFVFSQESLNKKRSNEDYVEMLYNTCLNRTSDSVGKQKWVAQLNAGVSREKVFWGFADSKEFEQIIASYGL